MLAAQPIDEVNRVFTMTDYETGQRLGFSLDTGTLLWGPSGIPYQDPGARAYQYYSGREGFPAYGNLYLGGFGGEVLCYSLLNGTLLWKYNNTYSGLEGPWGNHPTAIFAIADGKVFAFTNEHSPNYPMYQEQRIWVLDAFTGEEVWTLMSVAGTSGGSRAPTSLVADGFAVYYNFYDNKVYSIGKGPSATSIAAPDTGIPVGSSVLLQGRVTDEAAGTKQQEQAARFQDGVPAVSDESMTPWMEYVYMQKPKPEDVTGVEVHLTAIDPNGNFQDIGTAVSDASGNYALMWQPPVPGMYTVTAEFEGSESYWPSSDQTYFGVTEAASPQVTPTPTPPATSTPTPTGSVEPTTSPSPSPTSAVTPPGAETPTTTYIAIAAAVIVVIAVAADWSLENANKPKLNPFSFFTSPNLKTLIILISPHNPKIRVRLFLKG
jgi:outer membrane protein assembly factor BamB